MNRIHLRKFMRSAVAFSVAGAMAFSTVYPIGNAFAVTSDELKAQLSQAQAELSGLEATLAQAEAELGKTNYELDETKTAIDDLNVKIEDTKKELSDARVRLSSIIEETYKSGGEPKLFELVVSSTSFDELFSNIYYANKISAAKKDAINTIVTAQADLEQEEAELTVHQAELENLLVSQQTYAAEVESAAASQSAYVSQLSDEVRAAIEAERAAEAEASRRAAEEAMRRQQEEEAARKKAEEEAAKNNTDTGDSDNSDDNGNTDTGDTDTDTGNDSSDDTTDTGSDDSSTDDTSSDTGGGYYYYDDSSSEDYGQYTGDTSGLRSIAVNAALAQVGKPYGHDNDGTNFDCNGLCHYAWSVAGVSIPYCSGHYSYGQFQWLKNSGRWVNSVSQMQPGDLCFYSYDGGITTFHVAMYIGGGMVVQALGYSDGIQVTSYDWCTGFCGGGSPI